MEQPVLRNEGQRFKSLLANEDVPGYGPILVDAAKGDLVSLVQLSTKQEAQLVTKQGLAVNFLLQAFLFLSRWHCCWGARGKQDRISDQPGPLASRCTSWHHLPTGMAKGWMQGKGLELFFSSACFSCCIAHEKPLLQNSTCPAVLLHTSFKGSRDAFTPM